MPEATTRRLLLALTHVMAALFCVPQTAPGKALQPHEIASSELWEPQPERVRAELVRIPGSHLVDFAITTPDASGRTNWLSRDPLGESGGLNLYGFVGNDPINNYDYLGLADVYFDTKTGVVSWAVEIPRQGLRRDTDVFTFTIGVYEGDKILLSEVLGGYVLDRVKFKEWVDGRGYHGFEGMTDADKAFAIQMVAKAIRESTGIRYTSKGFGESVVGNLKTVIELSALHEDDAAEGLARLNSSLEAAGVTASLLEVAASFVPSVSLAEAISGESGAGIHELGLLERVLAGAGHAGKLGRITNHAADIGKNLGKAPNKTVTLAPGLSGADDALAAAARRVRPREGYFDIVVHGTPDGFQVLRGGEWVPIDHRALANFAKSAGHNGQPVRLISCNTGTCPTGVAQHLSNKLGVEVIAPDNFAHILPSGNVFVGPSSRRNTGNWVPFFPGGGR